MAARQRARCLRGHGGRNRDPTLSRAPDCARRPVPTAGWWCSPRPMPTCWIADGSFPLHSDTWAGRAATSTQRRPEPSDHRETAPVARRLNTLVLSLNDAQVNAAPRRSSVSWRGETSQRVFAFRTHGRWRYSWWSPGASPGSCAWGAPVQSWMRSFCSIAANDRRPSS
jgi:hypothetical protein